MTRRRKLKINWKFTSIVVAFFMLASGVFAQSTLKYQVPEPPDIGVQSFSCTGPCAESMAKNTPTIVGRMWLGETFDEMFPPGVKQQILANCAQKAARKNTDCAEFHNAMDINYNLRSSLTLPTQADAAVGFHADGLYWATVDFVKGHAVSFNLKWSRFVRFEEQVAQLTQKYGAPTSTSTTTLQNGFGAQFQCGNAAWSLPNGNFILAKENVRLEGSAFIREVTVTFVWKDAPEAHIAPAKNPY